MAPSLEVASHLSVRQLFERYRDCQDAKIKPHWQALWLRAKGLTAAEVGEAVGYKPDWVRQLVRRFNAGGPDAIRNNLKDNGRQAFLNDAQRAELFEALKGPPPDGGLWSGPKVARWVAEKTGRKSVCPQTGWEYLVALGFTLQNPRPRHVKARPDGRRWLKKRLFTDSCAWHHRGTSRGRVRSVSGEPSPTSAWNL